MDGGVTAAAQPPRAAWNRARQPLKKIATNVYVLNFYSNTGSEGVQATFRMSDLALVGLMVFVLSRARDVSGPALLLLALYIHNKRA